MILLIEAIKQVADGLSLEFCGVRLKKKKTDANSRGTGNGTKASHLRERKLGAFYQSV